MTMVQLLNATIMPDIRQLEVKTFCEYHHGTKSETARSNATPIEHRFMGG